jgi:hypothetical protein
MLTSEIPIYYEDKEVVYKGKLQRRRVCRGCKCAYAVTTSVGGALSKHIGECPRLTSYLKATAASSSSSPSSSSSSVPDGPQAKRQRTQGILDKHLKVVSNALIISALAEAFAFHSIPHHIIDSPVFREALETFRTGTAPLPNRRQLKEEQDAVAQRLRSDLLDRLRRWCAFSPLTVGIDGWTNTRHDKVTNVVLLCGGIAYYWCSIVNSVEQSTATWMHDPLTKVLTGLREEGLMFAAIVSDNEQSNKKLHRLLSSDFPFLIRSPCAAHVIQLCVHGSLALPSIKLIVTGMEELLTQFREKEARQRLRKVQQDTNVDKSHLQLIRPCATRWSAHLFAAQRLLKLRPFVDLIFHRPPDFWTNLQEVVRYLQPFQVATDIMQSDTSTLYDVYQQFNTIIQHVKDTPSSSFFHPAVNDILLVIAKHWTNHVHTNAVICSALVSFDTSVDTAFPDKTVAARKWFETFAAEYALHYNLTQTPSIASLKAQALYEWTTFMGGMPGTWAENIKEEIASLRRSHMAANLAASLKRGVDGEQAASNYTRWDPKHVWLNYTKHAPVIAFAAIAILSIAGSEAAVERTFSAQATVHTKKRNRLLDLSVEQEMFIKFNRQALQSAAYRQQHQHGGHYIELTADMEEVEVEDMPSLIEVFEREDVVRAMAAAEKEARTAARMAKKKAEKAAAAAAAGAEAAGLQALAHVEQKEEEKVEEEADVDGKQEDEEEQEAQMEASAPAPAVRQIPRPAPSADDVQRFIVEFVKEQRLTAKSYWSADVKCALTSKCMNHRPPLRDTMKVMKAKVEAYLQGAQPGEPISDESDMQVE